MYLKVAVRDVEMGKNISQEETVTGPHDEKNRTEVICTEENLEDTLNNDEQKSASTEEESLAELTATTNGVIFKTFYAKYELTKCRSFQTLLKSRLHICRVGTMRKSS